MAQMFFFSITGDGIRMRRGRGTRHRLVVPWATPLSPTREVTSTVTRTLNRVKVASTVRMDNMDKIDTSFRIRSKVYILMDNMDKMDTNLGDKTPTRMAIMVNKIDIPVNVIVIPSLNPESVKLVWYC